MAKGSRRRLPTAPAGGGGGLRRHDRAEEDAVLPVEGLEDERDDRGAAAAEEDGRDRHAAGSSHSGAMAGSWAAGAVKRALGWAAGVPDSGVQSSPFQSVRCAGGSSVIPSHHTSPSSVSAVLVKMVLASSGQHGVGVGVRVRPRGDAEEPGLGVDRVEPAVGAELHPADVVADGLDLPARQRRDQHGEVRLAASGGEGPGDVAGLAVGRGELEDQHVLGQPAVVAGHDRGDAQGEALLARAGRCRRSPSRRTRSRGSRGSGRCTCSRRRRATARRPGPPRAARRPSAGRARTRRRRRAPRGRRCPSGS